MDGTSESRRSPTLLHVRDSKNCRNIDIYIWKEIRSNIT